MAPENLKFSLEHKTVFISWNSAFPTEMQMVPETYTIDVSTDNGKSWSTYIEGHKKLYYSFETLQYGVSYQIRVKSQNRLGYSESTKPVTILRGTNNLIKIVMTGPL